jgi:hypothetical protein
MHQIFFRLTVMLSFVFLVSIVRGQDSKTLISTFRLESTDGLELVNAKAEPVTYRGERAVRLVPLPGQESGDGAMLAILAASEFKDGTIEVEVAGAPRPGVAPDMRGFVGILFRVQSHGERAENFYLRPTNGRADDQLRRNHSVQYESTPDFPWYRLRKENPGVYESYVDLEAGAWTRMKIVVAGTKARLYVNGADQPCLIVNDLKLGESHGQIAIWAHVATDAYFSYLTVK